MAYDTTTLNTGSGGDKILKDPLTTVDGAAAPTSAVANVQKVAYGAQGEAFVVSEDQPLPAKPQGFSTGGFWPEPDYQMPSVDLGVDQRQLSDVAGNLSVRGAVTTDEGSFREEFPGSSLTTDLTGTLTFTNGSNIVTGSGTAFLSELSRDKHIKNSAHAESAWGRVSRVISDTMLLLTEDYTGATISTGTSHSSNWETLTGSGGSIGVSSSVASIASGTTNAARTQLSRTVDFPPLGATFLASVSQRIANQEAYFGYQDNETSPSVRALVVFDGTVNTVLKFRTAFGTAAGETEEGTYTLPNALTTATSNRYRIAVLPDAALLFVNDVEVARHQSHIPGPYALMRAIAGIVNNAGVTTTTLAVDVVFLSNIDVLNVSQERAGLKFDSQGRQIIVPYTDGENSLNGYATATGTGDTAVLAAAGAALRNYVTTIVIYNDSTTNTYVNVKDGSTTKMVIPAPAKGGATIQLPVPLRSSLNTAINFASAASVTTMHVSMVGYKAP